MKRSIGVMEYGSMETEKTCFFRTPPPPHSTTPSRSRGFTLLEILISMVILSIALTVAWQTFSSAVRAWTSGREALDKMHHGDFVLTRLASALRSMVVFDSAPEKYGFRMENNPTGYGEHTICWVTDSDAFMPRNEPYGKGLHRIEIGCDTDDDNNEGLKVTVWPYLADEEEVEKKSWFVSHEIKGLRCRIYEVSDDSTTEGWTEEWEDTNKIPGLVEITLFADPVEENGDPLEFRQVIPIPLGPPVTNSISGAR